MELLGPVTVDDYHTAGEPFRIVVGGGPALTGATVLDRRSDAMARFDALRAFLVHEPRGHADMYGCFVTEPDDADGDLGVVFFHKDGFSTACGHGTIALARWAIDTGRVPRVEPVTRLVIDVPSGRLVVHADVVDGSVRAIRFRNVWSWVAGLDVAVPGLGLRVDIAYGGALYAIVRADALGLTLAPNDLGELIGVARRIKGALAGHPLVRHPDDARLSGLYGVIAYDERAAVGGAALHQGNVTVFADGEVDRSPCGSGTSARLAALFARGELGVGDVLAHDGIAGGRFLAHVVEAGTSADRPAVVTEISGMAYRTGRATFVLELGDPLGAGFLLR